MFGPHPLGPTYVILQGKKETFNELLTVTFIDAQRLEEHYSGPNVASIHPHGELAQTSGLIVAVLAIQKHIVSTWFHQVKFQTF